MKDSIKTSLMELDDNNSGKKKTLGRRKIEIKKIEKPNRVHVTFSKRRSGLFKKAGELSVLCGAEVAILVKSPANRIFAFGNPSVDSIIHRFLMTTGNSMIVPSHSRQEMEISKRKYEEAARNLDIEKEMMKKKKALMGKEPAGSNGNGFWWDEPIDNLGLQELEDYIGAMELLRNNVIARANELETMAMAAASSSSSSSSSSATFKFTDATTGEF